MTMGSPVHRIVVIIAKGLDNIVFLRSVRRLLVTANVVRSSTVLVTLIMWALRSSETSVLTRTTWRNSPEDGIIHGHRHESLKSDVLMTVIRNRAPV
jgi:hypothetical protein